MIPVSTAPRWAARSRAGRHRCPEPSGGPARDRPPAPAGGRGRTGDEDEGPERAECAVLGCAQAGVRDDDVRVGRDGGNAESGSDRECPSGTAPRALPMRWLVRSLTVGWRSWVANETDPPCGGRGASIAVMGRIPMGRRVSRQHAHPRRSVREDPHPHAPGAGHRRRDPHRRHPPDLHGPIGPGVRDNGRTGGPARPDPGFEAVSSWLSTSTWWCWAAAPVGTRPRFTARPAGLRIAMIEEARVGGTCLHRGCIPAKESPRPRRSCAPSATRRMRMPRASRRSTSRPAWCRKQKVIDRLAKGLETLLKGREVTVVPGTGTVVDMATRLVRVSDSDGNPVVTRSPATRSFWRRARRPVIVRHGIRRRGDPLVGPRIRTTGFPVGPRSSVAVRSAASSLRTSAMWAVR